MTTGAQPALPACRFSRLTVCALLILLLRCNIVLSQTLLEINLWEQLQSQDTVFLGDSPWRWRGDKSVALDAAVTIAGPGSIILDTYNAIITGSGGNASLTLRDVILFVNNSILDSNVAFAFPISTGPFPAFSGSNLTLTLVNVTIIAPFRALRNISSFWSAAGLLSALDPQLSGGLGSGPQRLASYNSPAGVRFLDVLLLPSDNRTAAVDCFAGGLPVTDSLSLRAAMDRADMSLIFIYKDFVIIPADFNYSRPVHITGNRSLEVYGCPGTTLDVNNKWTRYGVQIAAGGSLSLRGLTFTNAPIVNQIFWPRFMAPLLGLVYVAVGGGCSITDCSIISPDGGELGAYLATFSNLPSAARPVYTATANNNDSQAIISSWNITGADVWEPSLGIGATDAAASFWRMSNVMVVVKVDTCLSSMGTAGVNVDDRIRFRDLIKDEYISAIRVVADIELVASEWPPEASSPAGGQIFVNATKEVYACHPTPGQRYTIDFGNLGQVVFVFGKLQFRGSLLLTRPKPSPRRSWLYLLIGALSVETNGIIQFDGVEIRGNTSSPFTNAADPFWNYLTSCASYCSGFIPPQDAYLNISYYDAFIFQYRFNKTEWVAVSQNRSINGTGYWGYTDVALTWRPDTANSSRGDNGTAAIQLQGSGAKGKKSVPVAAIAAPVAVGGTLLIAAMVGLSVWISRRAADEKAAKAGDRGNAIGLQEGNQLARGLSYSGGAAGPDGGGDALTSSKSKSKEGGDTFPPGFSTANNPGGGNATASSTTFSTSMLSASAPTEARIEDMKRVLTAHNVLTSTHRNEQITLTELLGEGTFGKVYRGTWRGTTVAVKSMILPANMSGKEKREKMAIMETAISSSLSHPNIVQTYTYAILPVKGDINQTEGKLSAGASMTVDTSSPLASMSAADTNVHSWEVRLVLEFCDRGSLRDVLNSAVVAVLRAKGVGNEDLEAAGVEAAAVAAAAAAGAAQSPAGATAAGGDGAAATSVTAAAGGPRQLMPQPQLGTADLGPGVVSRESCPLGYAEVLDNCLDVARAMLHMHSENIVHGDLKARNILLKSGGVGDGRTYVAKVADFGLSLRIDPHETHVSNVYQGTITHMAPEVLLHGKVSKMSDVYAFAILMWETYSAGQAFKGTPRALLGHEVTKMNRRPQFPLDTPFDFQLLVCRCWESDPSIRPNFDQIVAELTRMRTKLAGDSSACPAAPLGPHPSGSAATAGTFGVSGAGAAAPAAPPLPGGGDSLTTASMASLPMVIIAHGGVSGGDVGGMGGGGSRGGGGEGMIQSVTLKNETGTTIHDNFLGGGRGLFYLQGLEGSTTMASQTSDGLNVAPGAFTIGARPPILTLGVGVGGGGGGVGPLPALPPPSMPPILEAYPAQQQPEAET